LTKFEKTLFSPAIWLTAVIEAIIVMMPLGKFQQNQLETMEFKNDFAE